MGNYINVNTNPDQNLNDELTGADISTLLSRVG